MPASPLGSGLELELIQTHMTQKPSRLGTGAAALQVEDRKPPVAQPRDAPKQAEDETSVSEVAEKGLCGMF